MSEEMRLLSICVQTGLHGTVKGLEGSGRNIPFLLVGYPGIAKTQVVKGLGEQIARSLGKSFPVETFAAPQRMPEEVGGIPVPFYEKEEVKCLPMRAGKSLLEAGRGLLFIDEYSSANQAMGGACMTLLQDGILGELMLPQSVARGAAMNPPECAANGRPLTAPEANRFCWIPWKLEFASFADYIRGGKGVLGQGVALPPDWEAIYGLQARGLVLSYLERNRAHFDVDKTMPKSHDCNKPWASPRSWLNTMRLLAACEAVGEKPDSDLAYMAICGCVGEGIADSFVGWFRDMDLPDPEELLKVGADKAQELLPNRPDKLQVALETLATAACKEHKQMAQRWKTAWEVLSPTLKKQPDNAIFAAKILSDNVHKIKDVKILDDLKKEGAMLHDLISKVYSSGG